MLFTRKAIHVAVGAALGAALLLTSFHHEGLISQAQAAQGQARPPSEVVVVTDRKSVV